MIGMRQGLSVSSRYFNPEETVKIMKRFAFSPIFSNSVIIKRSELMRAGGYRAELEWSCDTFAHHVVIFRNGFCYIPECLVISREHTRQYGRPNAGKPERERAVIKNILGALKQPAYADVAGAFEKTAPFSKFPWETLKVVLGDSDYKKYLSLKLVKYALLDKFVNRTLVKIFPPFVTDELRSLNKRIMGIVRRIRLCLK
jgi:hypothetical protein